MNLIEKLRAQADENPDRPALLDRVKGHDRELTYAELWASISAGATELKAAGLGKGDTIVFLHAVSLELYLGLLSALHAGMTAMFFDPSARKSFIDDCCRMNPPQALFASPKAHLLRITTAPIRRIPIRFHPAGIVPGSRRLTFQGGQDAPAEVPGDHPALITFTSGSTGNPKAIVRSHQFLLDQHTALASALHLRPGQVDLVTLPVFVLANLATGMTSVLADTDLAKPGQADADTILAQCRSTSPTRCAASPAFFQRLLQCPEALRLLDAVYTGGAPVFPALLDQLHAANPELQIHAVYGSSEAEPIAHLRHDEMRGDDRTRMTQGHGLLTGTPVPEIELAIIPDCDGAPLGPCSADEFEEMKLPPDTAGEIVVTGKHVLQGYLNGIGDEETKIRVGETVWHRTGDAGTLDQHGRLWLLGRASARLAATEELPEIYPFSIEVALSEVPGVDRVAALNFGGKRSVAIQGSPGDREALKAIFSWAGIERWIFMPKWSVIPMDRRHNAKVDYAELRDILQQLVGN